MFDEKFANVLPGHTSIQRVNTMENLTLVFDLSSSNKCEKTVSNMMVASYRTNELLYKLEFLYSVDKVMFINVTKIKRLL